MQVQKYSIWDALETASVSPSRHTGTSVVRSERRLKLMRDCNTVRRTAATRRHFADSISKSLIGREIFFPIRCQERSSTGAVVAALQPRSRCDAMIGICRAGTNRGVRTPDVSARGLRVRR
jgi:hypothetical protein